MPENAGLYQKFNVTRRDGKDRPNAAYFVLDVVNDEHARAALRAYADSCGENLPDLAADLYSLLAESDKGGPHHEKLRTPRA